MCLSAAWPQNREGSEGKQNKETEIIRDGRKKIHHFFHVGTPLLSGGEVGLTCSDS